MAMVEQQPRLDPGNLPTEPLAVAACATRSLAEIHKPERIQTGCRAKYAAWSLATWLPAASACREFALPRVGRP
jgi:hypothetical protein